MAGPGGGKCTRDTSELLVESRVSLPGESRVEGGGKRAAGEVRGPLSLGAGRMREWRLPVSDSWAYLPLPLTYPLQLSSPPPADPPPLTLYLPPPLSLTSYGSQHQSAVLDGVCQRTDDVEGGGVGNQARAGHAAVRRLETNDAAEVRRLADAAAYSVGVWKYGGEEVWRCSGLEIRWEGRRAKEAMHSCEVGISPPSPIHPPPCPPAENTPSLPVSEPRAATHS